MLPEQARAHNRALVLRMLFHHGAMSRADLARETGLTRVTISDLVADAIADGLIHELGVRESTGPGKPPMQIDIDRVGHEIIGIDLSGTATFDGAVLDLGGALRERRSVALPADIDAESAYTAALALIRELLALATRPVLGVGVGTPGIVDPHGSVVSAPTLAWQDFPLEPRLTADLGLPVLVRNDANAAVLAEYTFGTAGPDVMLVRIGRGVGAGLIAGGTPLGGRRYAAGEIGHVVVDGEGAPSCTCGRVGCLEAWARVPRLLREIERRPERREEILAEAGARLGAAIAPIVAALDLGEIVIAGSQTLLSGAFADAATRALHERTLSGVFADVRVRVTEMEGIVLRGAAVLVLSDRLGVS